MPSIQAAKSAFAVEANVTPVHARDEIEGVIAAQGRNPGSSLIVMPDVFNDANRELIMRWRPATASRRSIPVPFLQN